MDRKPWLEKYMRELSRKKRRLLLEEAVVEEGMSPENELRKKLYEARFGLNEKAETDLFIRGWMTLYNLQNAPRGIFGKKRIQRDLAQIQADWKYDLAASYGSIGEEVLYEELYHMILVYIQLCMTDRNYSSLLLGMGRMQEETLIVKIAGDLCRTAWDIPAQLNCVEDFAILRRAAEDAFCDRFPDDDDVIRRKIEAVKK